jgi:hypothetical protein
MPAFSLASCWPGHVVQVTDGDEEGNLKINSRALQDAIQCTPYASAQMDIS